MPAWGVGLTGEEGEEEIDEAELEEEVQGVLGQLLAFPKTATLRKLQVMGASGSLRMWPFFRAVLESEPAQAMLRSVTCLHIQVSMRVNCGPGGWA